MFLNINNLFAYKVLKNSKNSLGHFVILIISCICLPKFVTGLETDQECHCILLKDCKTYSDLLLSSDASYRLSIVDLIRRNTCGFIALDVMVCCPMVNSPQFSPDPDHFPKANSIESREKLMKLIDYKDDFSDLNCPHVFYEEMTPTNFGHINSSHFSFQINHDLSKKIVQENNYKIVFPDDERFKNRFQSSFENPLQIVREIPKKSKPRIKVYSPKDGRIVFPDDFPEDANFRNQFDSESYLQQPYNNPPDCGVLSNSNSGGGNNVPRQFPWIVRIGYLNKTSMTISYRCSGSFVSDTFIITAAHCVTNLVPALELTHIRLGDTFDGTGVITFPIKDIMIHPNYDKPKYANDIGLIKIDNPLSNEGYLSKICLPLNTAATQADKLIGRSGIVAGWVNQNNENDPSQTKNATVKFLRLAIVNNTECAINYASYTENFQTPIVITPAHMCAQSNDNKNHVCQGDSGGPFMDDGSLGTAGSRGKYTLLGIVAFGPTVCDFTHIPGVYMRVTSFLDWIIGIVK